MKVITRNMLAAIIGLSILCFSATAAQFSAKDLAATPEVITIDNKKLVLHANLSRDFMPISPPEGKPLAASLEISTLGNVNLPLGLEVECVWLVNGNEVWSTSIFNVKKRDHTSAKMWITVGSDLYWRPETKVDIVIRLKDVIGQAWLLKAGEQVIHRTE